MPTVVEVYCDSRLLEVTLRSDGTPNLTNIWKQKLSCFDDGAGDMPFKHVTVETPIQKAAVAAAKKAGYGEDDGSGVTQPDDSILHDMYTMCAANDPEDPYVTMTDYGPTQVAELQAVMALCPAHPQAVHWKKGIANSLKMAQAEKNGTLVHDGTYLVPSDMKRGTFVAKDVKDCYWETRDSRGEILANNFVIAAPRVEATVSQRAVVFTSQGCGAWLMR